MYTCVHVTLLPDYCVRTYPNPELVTIINGVSVSYGMYILYIYTLVVHAVHLSHSLPLTPRSFTTC